MTPEEMRAVAEKNLPMLPKHEGCNPGIHHPMQMICPSQVEALLAAERERCAKEVREYVAVLELAAAQGARTTDCAEACRNVLLEVSDKLLRS